MFPKDTSFDGQRDVLVFDDFGQKIICTTYVQRSLAFGYVDQGQTACFPALNPRGGLGSPRFLKLGASPRSELSSANISRHLLAASALPVSDIHLKPHQMILTNPVLNGVGSSICRCPLLPIAFQKHFSSKSTFQRLLSTAGPGQTPILWTYIPHQVPYRAALDFQDALVRHKISQPAAPDWLVLLQHKPVYTTGRRETGAAALAAERARLARVSPDADFVETLRGGQTTFHGPGQLVGYPIIHIGRMELTVRLYVDMLLGLLRDVLLHHTLPRPIETLDPALDPALPVGTFVGSAQAKIASVGVQIRRRVSSHGFALNVEQACERPFTHIVPCGLADVRLVSIESILGGTYQVRVEDLVRPTVEVLGNLFGREMRELSEDCEKMDPIGYRLVQHIATPDLT